MFADHGLGGLLEEGGHGKSPKCLSRNLGDLGGFCKGLGMCIRFVWGLSAWRAGDCREGCRQPAVDGALGISFEVQAAFFWGG